METDSASEAGECCRSRERVSECAHGTCVQCRAGRGMLNRLCIVVERNPNPRGEEQSAHSVERLGIRMNKSLSVNKQNIARRNARKGKTATQRASARKRRHRSFGEARHGAHAHTQIHDTLTHNLTLSLSFSSHCSTRLSFRVSPSRFAPFVSFSRHVPTSSALLLCLPPFWSHCVAAFIVLLLSLSLYIHHTRVL